MNIQEKFENLSLSISKYFFRANQKSRIELYTYLISGLKSGLSLNIKKVIENRIRRHDRIHSKKNIIKRILTKPGGSEMPFLKDSMRKIEEGANNADLFSEGWVTPNEEMLISSNSSGNMADSLILAVDLLKESSRIKKSVMGQLIQPIFLFIVLIGLMFGFSFHFIPILEDLSNPEEWDGGQKLLYSLSMFIQDNALMIPVILAAIVFSVLGTLGIWYGKVRENFDSFPPWSMYREFNAALFLISLATMMKNGTTFINSLNQMSKTASPYVQDQIIKMVETAKRSEKDNSSALNTHLMGDVGDDIEDLSRYGSFEKVLNEEGKRSIEYIIQKISKQAKIFKSLALVAVVFYIVWAFGTFISIVQDIGNTL